MWRARVGGPHEEPTVTEALKRLRRVCDVPVCSSPCTVCPRPARRRLARAPPPYPRPCLPSRPARAEYKGWHSKSNPAPNEAWKWKYEAPKGYAIPTHVSRGPKLRVSENAGFAWDPSAAYGPETVQAMPNVDNKLKEDMFDESADQKFDGVPGTGVEHFGLSGMNTGTIAKSQHAALPPAPF